MRECFCVIRLQVHLSGFKKRALTPRVFVLACLFDSILYKQQQEQEEEQEGWTGLHTTADRKSCCFLLSHMF